MQAQTRKSCAFPENCGGNASPWTAEENAAGFDLTGAGAIDAASVTATDFISGPCVDLDCGVDLDHVVGVPAPCVTNHTCDVNDDGERKVGTGSTYRPVLLGTGSAVYGWSAWAISDGDAVCAAAGTPDLTPTCGQEVASNMGLLGGTYVCQDVIEYSVVAVPTDSTCTTTHANNVKIWVMLK